MWKTTIKGLLAHKLRLGLTALAVVLGVAFISGTFVLTDTMNNTFDNLFAEASEGIDVVVRSESAFESQLGGSRQPFDESILLTVSSVDGVRVASGSVQGSAQFVDPEGEAITTGGAPTLGLSWYDDPQGATTIRSGRAPMTSEEVMIDAGTAEEHSLEVGDQVQVLTANSSRDYQIVGVAGFGDADNLAGATLAFFDLKTAQTLFGKQDKFDQIDVAADDGVTVADLAGRIADVLPDRVEAVSAASVAEEQAESLKSLLVFFNTALLVFAGISLFVGAFIIFNTFSITVAQRTREFALLRALGASGGQVTGAVLLEALLVGIFASAVGILAGFGIALALRGILEAFGIELPSSGLVFLPRTAIVAGGVGIVVTLVAAIGPARRASSISPMAALRESTPKVGGFSMGRAAVGLLMVLTGGGLLMAGLLSDIQDPVRLVGAGAVVILLGVATLTPLIAGPLARLIGEPVARMRNLPGKLARKNAARNPRRTAATAAALMIGLALVGFVSIMAASLKASTEKVLEESFKADYMVSSSSFGAPAISPQVAEELYDLEEVEVVAPIRVGQFRRDDGRTFIVAATDPDAVREVVDIQVVEGDLDQLDEGGLFLYRQAAEDLGVDVGDSFTMEFPSIGEVPLEVVGTFENKSVVGTDYLISLGTFDANSPDRFDAQLLVNLKPGVSAMDAENALESIEERFPNIQIDDQAQAKERSSGQVDQLLGIVSALLGLALIIALLGITNTLALSVFERNRELGLLRAVGMARKQVRSMIRWESVIIAIIGAVLGLLVGIIFGWAIVTSLESEGISELVIPGVQLVGYVFLGGLAGVLAAVPPARRAARLNVLEAISTE